MGSSTRTEHRDGRGRGAPNAARRSRAGALPILVAVLLAAVSVAPVAAETPAPRAEAAGDWQGWEAQPLRVQVWHDRDEGEVYERGDPVQVGFQTNMDAYVVVYRIDADGEVTILWPRSRYDDGFVFGHHEYSLPADGAPRLRAGGDEGIEYVEALASLYPFDLRELKADFHQETGDDRLAFTVAGDPFLAMNEVNFAITGLEDPEDYVVTDYTSWYVHRRVDHPRYLCGQCHDAGYRPYDDHCAVEIHYDFGWYNRWYLRFGYYPAYYYPAYYYVDPWTWRPWVNYWYTPWYRWPGYAVYDWPYVYYPWWDSPYYRGDAWAYYRRGHRRALPLSKLYGTRDRDSFIRRRSLMVADRATDAMRESLRRRQPLAVARTSPATGGQPTTDGRVKDRGAAVSGRQVYRDVDPVRRDRVVTRTTPQRDERGPGLRLDQADRSRRRVLGDRARSGPAAAAPGADRTTGRGRGDAPTVLRGGGAGSSRSVERPGGTNRAGQDQRSLRPVQPRKPGSRIWSGGRSSPQPDRRARPGRVERDGGSARQPAARPSTPARPKVTPQRPTTPSRERAEPSRPPARRDGDSGRSVGSSSSRRSGGGASAGPRSRPSGSSGSSSRSSGRSAGSSRSGGQSRSRGGGRG